MTAPQDGQGDHGQQHDDPAVGRSEEVHGGHVFRGSVQRLSRSLHGHTNVPDPVGAWDDRSDEAGRSGDETG
jgi:hypothetical protein